MKGLSKSGKLNFYLKRKRKGDVTLLAENTGYSVSHVSNVLAGRRNVPEFLANEMYNISRRRKAMKSY